MNPLCRALRRRASGTGGAPEISGRLGGPSQKPASREQSFRGTVAVQAGTDLCRAGRGSKRYRSRGPRLVEVKRVDVEGGSKAVIGHFQFVNEWMGKLASAGLINSKHHRPARLRHRENAAYMRSATIKRTGRPCRPPAAIGWTNCRLNRAGSGKSPLEAHPNSRRAGRAREGPPDAVRLLRPAKILPVSTFTARVGQSKIRPQE